VAGCSTATVSKALNGLPVSAENLKRVFAAVEEVGYVPNLAARAMRSEKTMTLGMVVNFEGHPRSELLGVFQSMIGHMESEGYSVLLSIVRNGGVALDTLLQRFVAHRVDGLFYWNARPSSSLIWYERTRVPVVAVGFRDPACASLPFVTIDGAPAFMAACKDLKSLGHKYAAEIAIERAPVLHKLFASPRSMKWLDIRVGSSLDELREVVKTQLCGRGAPTAVFATPPTSTQILAVAEELGIRIPEDLSLIALSDLDEAPLLRTPLSGLRTDYEKMGHAAALTMMEALAGNRVQDVILGDSVHYIPRGSTGPARVD
jgi:LacI family transcriptional regulator